MASAVLARAFYDDPLFMELCAHPGRRPGATRHIFASELVDAVPNAEVKLAVDGDRVVGVAAWYDSEANYPLSPVRQLRQGVRVLPSVLGTAGMSFKGLRLLKDIEERHPKDRPHLYLAALGVDPGWQAKGIGRRLIADHLARADERGLGCYLETQTESNVSYYSRSGFEIVDRQPAWEGGPPLWFMWRDPANP